MKSGHWLTWKAIKKGKITPKRKKNNEKVHTKTDRELKISRGQGERMKSLTGYAANNSIPSLVTESTLINKNTLINNKLPDLRVLGSQLS